jgi:hypothetical protein
MERIARSRHDDVAEAIDQAEAHLGDGVGLPPSLIKLGC